MTDNDITTDVTEAKPEMVLMQRDPDKVPGLGVCKMLVPADEVPLFEKSGWMKSEQ